MRVRLLRIVGLLLDAGEVAKRSLVDRVAAPVLAARPIARSDGDDPRTARRLRRR
jgi:hypothetical protein